MNESGVLLMVVWIFSGLVGIEKWRNEHVLIVIGMCERFGCVRVRVYCVFAVLGWVVFVGENVVVDFGLVGDDCLGVLRWLWLLCFCC